MISQSVSQLDTIVVPITGIESRPYSPTWSFTHLGTDCAVTKKTR
ncbi:hypothetical protein [Brachybacterium tyrofermentans]